tara:strand:+ start:3785 stop:4861 length:1077 start_codon:yes stop_codon:yes gene_type:complete
MTTMNKFLLKTGILILALSSVPLSYGQNLLTRDEEWTAINLLVTDELVIPAYQNLQTSSLELVSATENFCSDISAENLNTLQAAFHQTMSGWQAIQHIQFGPITYFNWNFRLQYWPDERGTSARQLTTLIASQDESVLTTDMFARQSVGVQGLPALERMLFDDEPMNNFRNDSYLCLLSVTIARNINEISAGVLQRWVEEYRAIVLEPVASGFYENAEDLSIDFLKALQEAIAKIRDLKLAPALGDSFAAARNREAESWRSERSLANIKVNLLALEPLFAAYSAAFHEADAVAVMNAFAELTASLADMPDSMTVALSDEEQYVQLQSVHTQMDTLHEALELALKNTDLYLGFNSLDGD